MIKLNYSIEINAKKEHVWKTMLDKENYKKWARVFSEGSTFRGKWEQGETLLFIDPDLGGTKAVLEVCKPYDEIFAKHISMVDKDMNENNEDEMSKKWIGSTEKYTFTDSGDSTKLEIEMTVEDTFTEMFETSWPKALEIIKSLSEPKK